MAAVPAIQFYDFDVQDDRGFRARVRILGFTTDVSTDAALVSGEYTIAAGIGTALQAMTNAKVVRSSFGFAYQIAQEPSTETGTYQLVQDKAVLTFGDGTILKEHLYVPAPKDALFLTTSQDNLIVVNPASSLVTGMQTATNTVPSPAGGTIFSQFFGGQYQGKKSRRRRVLQGA